MTIILQTTPTDPAALARRPDPAGPLAVATPTTRKLADASLSVNTRRAYAGALRRVDAGRGAAPVDDASLAVYLGAIFEAGRAPATAALAVTAVRFRAKLAGQPAPAGEATARVLGGYRRTAADRGRGQAAPLRADGLAAILATAERPRTDGRGVESHTTAHRRGRLDAVIASLLFMGGLRRSEVSALEWRDVSDARDGDGVLLTVRTSKTNHEGDAADVRYLKNGAANAIRTLRAADADAAPTDRTGSNCVKPATRCDHKNLRHADVIRLVLIATVLACIADARAVHAQAAPPSLVGRCGRALVAALLVGRRRPGLWHAARCLGDVGNGNVSPPGGLPTQSSAIFYLLGVRMIETYQGQQDTLMYRALQRTAVNHVGEALVYWRVLDHARVSPHLLVGFQYLNIGVRRCFATGEPVPREPDGYHVDFAPGEEQRCGDDPLMRRHLRRVVVAGGVDIALGSRVFARVQAQVFSGSIRVSQRYFGAFRCFSWVI